jgi:CMP/dCMP kinase
MREKGDIKISIEEIEKDISYRDKNDSTRSIAPLVKAEDAVLLDTTDLTIDQVVNKVISLMDEKCLEK